MQDNMNYLSCSEDELESLAEAQDPPLDRLKSGSLSNTTQSKSSLQQERSPCTESNKDPSVVPASRLKQTDNKDRGKSAHKRIVSLTDSDSLSIDPQDQSLDLPSSDISPGNFRSNASSKDVIFGRGQPIRDHIGNRAMRAIIGEFTADYRAVSKSQRSLIIHEVRRILVEKGALFLFPETFLTKTIYRIANKEEVRHKISHALRDAIKREDKLDCIFLQWWNNESGPPYSMKGKQTGKTRGSGCAKSAKLHVNAKACPVL